MEEINQKSSNTAIFLCQFWYLSDIWPSSSSFDRSFGTVLFIMADTADPKLSSVPSYSWLFLSILVRTLMLARHAISLEVVLLVSRGSLDTTTPISSSISLYKHSNYYRFFIELAQISKNRMFIVNLWSGDVKFDSWWMRHIRLMLLIMRASTLKRQLRPFLD